MVQALMNLLGDSSICVCMNSLMVAVKKFLVEQSDRVYPMRRECRDINAVRNHYSLHHEFSVAY
jgi:hypothetical protein